MEWYVNIIGIVAALLTTFGFVPQIIKMRRTKSVKDVSLTTMLQLTAGVTLWVVYGIYRGDSIIIAANAVTFLTLVFAIALYHRYNRSTGQ